VTDQQSFAGLVRRLFGNFDNLTHHDLRGRVVADLGCCDPELHEVLLQAGVSTCYAVGLRCKPVNDSRVINLPMHPFDDRVPLVDTAYFDCRTQPDFDHVNGVTALVQQMRRIIQPGGVVFAVLKSGVPDYGFDVHNAIVRNEQSVLPSQEYLFSDLLGPCTIRTMEWLPTPHKFEHVRLFRLSLKRPTLLLVLASSQAGKTSLARDLQTLDGTMHVSNDYIYCEIVARLKPSNSAQYPAALMELAGDGSGSACASFNRTLESNPELLRMYLESIIPLLPRNKRVISMDFDLTGDSQINLAKEFFAAAGFSVWVVRR
jgi:hypothetical protein